MSDQSLASGTPMPYWQPAPPVAPVTLTGRYVTLRPLTTADAATLLGALADESLWTYRPEPTPRTVDELAAQIESHVAGEVAAFAVLPEGHDEPRGRTTVHRVDPANGCAEIGYIQYAPSLQGTRASSEATYLLLCHLFETLGYRRVEWKCNALNAPSRRAALRMGFVWEGRFRQHQVVRAHNRDTDWFAVVDSDWWALREEWERWLDPANFTSDGRQRTPLHCQRPASSWPTPLDSPTT